MPEAEAPALWREIESFRRQHHEDYARALAEHHIGTGTVPDGEFVHLHHQLVELARQAGVMFPDISFTRLRAATPNGWHLTNPAVHPTSMPPRAAVRVVNFRHTGEGYAVDSVDGIVRTRPAMVGWNAGSGETSAFALVDDHTAAIDDESFDVRGYEDLRPFRHAGTEYGIASIRNRNPQGVCQQVLVRWDNGAITEAHPLSTVDEGHHKNWMPVFDRDILTFVDHCSPLRIRTWNPETGTTTIVRNEPGIDLARTFRGSSCLAPIANGYLAVVHEVVQFGQNRRTYVHRFVQFDRHLDIVAVSDQFWLLKRGVEFVAGLRIAEGHVDVSFGVDDSSAWIAHFPLADVMASLQPVAERIAHPGPPPRERDVPPIERRGIASITLTHDGREDALRDALASVVDHVDWCVVVNTGSRSDGDDVAREIAGDKAVIVRHVWKNDFSDARNASLRLAAEHTTAAWGVICDSDEELQIPHPGLHALLAPFAADTHSISTNDRSRSYSKVRIFRLPTPTRFVGTTHEYVDTNHTRQESLRAVTFAERPKPADEGRFKSSRDLAILLDATRRSPLETRWWHYLGNCLNDIDDHYGAIDAYQRCIELTGWPEEAAWASYKEAQAWTALERFDKAVHACSVGISLHPGIAELPWYASFVNWKRQRYRDAVFFANLAIVHGEYVGLAAETNRISFRHFHALYEGPFDVLRFAYRKLGDSEAADQAEQDFQAAKALRERHGR